MLKWNTQCVTVYEAGTIDEPYRFRDMQSALIFLDALLLHYVARLGRTVAALTQTLDGMWEQERGKPSFTRDERGGTQGTKRLSRIAPRRKPGGAPIAIREPAG